ncbi:MAG TPA: hypothetical protein VGR56_01860 [Nitrososphaerales archaeon]|nr:hypothetical protein [Nitrososphaerales archaeon]
MVRELILGETTLNKGGTVEVPEKAMEALSLRPMPGERSKLLWTPARNEAIVTKGTLQSDWRKSMFRNNGTAAIPRHVQQALKLRTASKNEDRVLWISKGNQVVVRKRTRTSIVRDVR